MNIFDDNQEVLDPGRGNKYYGVACELKRRIDCGEIKYRLPSLPQMTREFKITPMTAHRAVKLLREQGIVYSERGRGTFVTRLKRQRTNTLGAVLHGVAEGPMHTSLMGGIRRACDQHEQHLLLEHHDNEAEREMDIVRKLWEEQMVDGIILWPATSDHDFSPTVAWMMEQKVPFVLIPEPDARLYAKCHTVSNDQSGAVVHMMDHLVATGHQRIGFLGDVESRQADYFIHRLEGYQNGLAKHRLAPHEPLLLHTNKHGETLKCDTGLVNALHEFDAVFCITDNLAAQLCRVCLREGIRVPGDLAIAGYDNNKEAILLGLTTADQHVDRIGAAAAEVLFDEIQGNLEDPVHKIVPSELIIRESTAAPAKPQPGK
jgi:DNA-binding LacI/PurR family transcriptional regulator